MKYPYIIDKEHWPINLASKRREEIKALVVGEAYENLIQRFSSTGALRDMLEKTIYSEKYRVKNEAWDVDPKGDGNYWKSLGKKIYETDPVLMDESKAQKIEQQITKDIVTRYTDEIMGNFNSNFYEASARIAPLLFGRLFKATADEIRSPFFPKTLLQDKLVNLGPINKIRNLAKIGTIILLPTHFSNLDSMMIGYGISNMGLPPFQYAAGLNLFNSKVFGYFMERLGAYKLDRRKKNPIYLETLKSFSRTNIEEGVHTLFFPGGTRSRSGAIESRLKLGLLGTIIEAQRAHCEENPEHPKKAFIVPLCMSYHFVLEANSLIDEHLKKTGKEHYITIDDEFSDFNKIVGFLWKVYTQSSEISLSFGEPTDVFGNYVYENGISLDHKGKELNISKFFVLNGKIQADYQREQEYTRQLGERIIKDFHKINVVYASHLVAFVAFQILFDEHPKTELYSFLKIPPKNLAIDYSRFEKITKAVLSQLYELRENGDVMLARHMEKSVDEVIQYGLDNIGIYHTFHPLKRNGNLIISENLKLLYFYHNRLEGYELDKIVKQAIK